MASTTLDSCRHWCSILEQVQGGRTGNFTMGPFTVSAARGLGVYGRAAGLTSGVPVTTVLGAMRP